MRLSQEQWALYNSPSKAPAVKATPFFTIFVIAEVPERCKRAI